MSLGFEGGQARMSSSNAAYPPTGEFIQAPDGTLLPIVVGPGGEPGVVWQGQFVRLQDLPFQAVPFDTTGLPEVPVVEMPGGPIGPLLPPPPPPPPAGPTGPPVIRNFNFTWLTFVLLIGVMAILITIVAVFVGAGSRRSTTASATRSPNAPRYGLNLTVSGTAGGQTADSQVFAPGSLSCTSTPDPQGELIYVNWTGRLADGRPVSGEFVGHLGRTDFGTDTPNSVGNANVSFGNSGRVGGGIGGGTGSLTIDSTTSGSIDAELETGGQVHVYGKWTCAS
jgi:hypothetical protein